MLPFLLRLLKYIDINEKLIKFTVVRWHPGFGSYCNNSVHQNLFSIHCIQVAHDPLARAFLPYQPEDYSILARGLFHISQAFLPLQPSSTAIPLAKREFPHQPNMKFPLAKLSLPQQPVVCISIKVTKVQFGS